MTLLRYRLRRERDAHLPIEIGFWITPNDHPDWHARDELSLVIDFASLEPELDTLITVRDDENVGYFRILAKAHDVEPVAAAPAPPRSPDGLAFILVADGVKPGTEVYEQIRRAAQAAVDLAIAASAQKGI